ncbi:MAG: membrane protein insertion efficiency factor YidD [Bacteroidales bacterium]|nr:membrane protein insertion efficiency factor YidD [Bacteroidales bacterium]
MVKSNRLSLILLVLFGMLRICPGQMEIDEDLLSLFQNRDTVEQDFRSPLREATNDITTIASAGFLFYKSFISSQDNPSCVFTPSCSEYAMLSIQKKGFFLGWLHTFDRLSRCHGLVNHNHYPFDIEHNRYYDPVQ